MNLEVDMCQELSRIITFDASNHFDKERDEYAFTHSSGMNIVGRIVLNIWRIAR
jgi:hypothetical protein